MSDLRKILHAKHKFRSHDNSESFYVDGEEQKEDHCEKYITFPIKCCRKQLSTREQLLLMKQRNEEFAKGLRTDFEHMGLQNVVVADEDDWFPEVFIEYLLKKIRNWWNYYFNPSLYEEEDGTRYWTYPNCELYLNRKFVKRDKKCKPFANSSTQSSSIVNSRMFAFLKNPPMWDFEIQVDKYIFRVHSRVLISQSIFFRNMLRISSKKSNGRPKEKKELLATDRNGQFKYLSRWETPFVTPEEMEAVLVFIYSHTWPRSVMDKNGHLSQRFLLALEEFGVSMKTMKEKSGIKDNLSCEIFKGSRVQKIFSWDNMASLGSHRPTHLFGMGDFYSEEQNEEFYLTYDDQEFDEEDEAYIPFHRLTALASAT